MKIFRLVKAELRKIFLRPTLFIMVALLLICSFVALIAFNPDKRTNDAIVTTHGGTVAEIYANFIQSEPSTSYTTKSDLDKRLTDALSSIETFTKSDNLLSELKEIVLTSGTNYNFLTCALENAARPTGTISREEYFNEANKCLKNFKSSLSATMTTFGKFKNSNRYYLTVTEFDELNETLKKIDSQVIVYDSLQTEKTYANLLNRIRKYEFDKLMNSFIESVDQIIIKQEKFDEIKQNYYIPTSTRLNSLASKIETYYGENLSKGEQQYREELTSLISDYKAYVNMGCENLECALNLEIANNKSDKTMQSYLGYSTFNRLTISSSLQKNSAMIENNISPHTLDAMSFGVNCGDETNAWDFVCFAMNITSLLIIIFCVIMCSKMIAGEQASGTMKMLAIRPFSRNKILGGKLLATMFFSMIFVIFSFVVNFAIGWAFFGVPDQMMIGVFNGSHIILAHPLVFCLFLILSLFLKVFIYVSIATMISTLFRSYTGSSIISFAIVIITLILNGVLATKHFFKYFPMANFDIYKYFTSSQTASGFKAIFSSPQIIDTSFGFTFVYAIVTLIVLNGISFIAFNKKDIA